MRGYCAARSVFFTFQRFINHMNELATKYLPGEVEEKWYAYWMEHKLFRSEPDGREPYTIVIPPPNVTGVLHMGHMLNNTIQDILVRRARMSGKNALWVPGTDHASIATEAKVVAKLAAEGIKKSDLTREKFLEHAWAWTEKHGGIILKQLRKLGASCDWERTAFTMDPQRSEAVVKIFVDLYNKGLIYRGVRMVNWDPSAKTALSDEEVIYQDEHSKLFYLKYYVEGDEQNRYIVIATTRPETILGDTAVCVNPADERYTWLHGKNVIIPLVGRSVPVIADSYVEMDFGTGCLKVTPAHDVNDYMLGEKYNLPSIDIFNDDGTISEQGGMYIGHDRFDVRKEIIKDLNEKNLVEKIEDYDNKVGYSERTKVVIEPKLSMQWFLKMTDLCKPALKAVMDDDIRFYPSKFKNIYSHWMTDTKDWCISRQLWWGHRIPAYYLPEGGYVVAATPEKALELAHEKTGNKNLVISDLRQDDDCLDTWFSSWLWPISLFDGIMNPGNEEIKYYYPTSDLVTAPDIMFFWVARMIIAGYEFMGDKPFGNVYFTGIVRDKIGRKMSKQLGNSPDPLELIERFGADGVRMGMLLSAPAGNDIMFDEKLCETGRNFCNKIWNAFRLVQGWKVDENVAQPDVAATAARWFNNCLSQSIEEISDLFAKFRLSEALNEVYRLFWDNFSAQYLEIIKPAFGEPIDKKTLTEVNRYFDSLLRLLHPFMPFITEELWQHLEQRREGESIMYASLPVAGTIDNATLASMENAFDIIAAVRGIRASKNISPKEALDLNIVDASAPETEFCAVIKKLANIKNIEGYATNDATASAFMVGNTKYNVPLGNEVDVEAEKEKLQKDIVYYEGLLASIKKKLSNERFVSNAPVQVVELERKKQADTQSRLSALRESLEALNK